MKKEETKVFCIDGDEVEVGLVYDEEIGRYVYDYPDFELTPRYTLKGRKWVNVTCSSCPYADKTYGDCGSCEFFTCEKAGDLIGVCSNEEYILNLDEKGQIP